MEEFIICFAILYVVSMIVVLLMKHQLRNTTEKWDGHIFSTDFIVDFFTYAPLLNSIMAFLLVRDAITDWWIERQIRKILKKIKHKVDPDLQKEIDELL